MTLTELEKILQSMRGLPCVDDHTEIRVLKYKISAVRISFPVVGLDGQCIDPPMSVPFAITVYPTIED